MNKTENFIIKAVNKHGNRFDYSLVEYITGTTNITIICKEHGTFQQAPKTHLQGFGCSKCSGLHKMNTQEFVTKSKLKHGDTYEYTLSNYVNNKTKLIITCKTHGDFLQAPNHHLNGKGCRKCRDLLLSKKFSSTTEDFILKAKALHNNNYTYELVEYINNRTKVVITCKYHGTFLQTPNQHLGGHGCKQCADISSLSKRFMYYRNTPTTVYIIKYQELYKIGITTKSVQERYSNEVKDISKIQIVTEILFPNYKDAYDYEQKLITANSHYKYVGEPIFNNTGITEIFTGLVSL